MWSLPCTPAQRDLLVAAGLVVDDFSGENAFGELCCLVVVSDETHEKLIAAGGYRDAAILAVVGEL